MFPTLAMRVAQLQRRVAAYITSIVTAQIRRAWNVLEWDENQHPRGPNGKFIGGAGLQAERDAYHAERALHRFNTTADSMHLQGAMREHAGRQIRLTLHKGQTLTGVQAIQAHHDAMVAQAAAHAQQDTPDRDEANRLAFVRSQYARVLQYEHSLQYPDITPATRARLEREIAIIDRYFARMWIPSPKQVHLPLAEKNAIRQQIITGLESDPSAPPVTASDT